MNEGISLQQLEAELKRLDAQREIVLRYIALKKGESPRPSAHIVSGGSGSASVRGRVIDAVVELVQKNGRQVTNKEILAYVIEDKQLSLGNVKNKVTGLGAMLSQECAKKTARIRQVSRGVYDLK
jgi:hypothetical protein